MNTSKAGGYNDPGEGGMEKGDRVPQRAARSALRYSTSGRAIKYRRLLPSTSAKTNQKKVIEPGHYNYYNQKQIQQTLKKKKKMHTRNNIYAAKFTSSIAKNKQS